MVLLVPVRRASLLVAALAFPACDLDPGSEPNTPPPPGLTVPQPHTPMSNAYVGSVHVPLSLMPTFSWAPGAGSAPVSYYELQISTDPAFARSLLTLTTGQTRVKPTFELPISRQVPVGTLYYWRVRACDVDCSEFSSARTLNLGRSEHDVNGDGLADVLVSSPAYGGDHLGRVEVYLGSLGAAFDGEPDGTLVAPVAKDFFGIRVAPAGDFNGDGFADVIVGAPDTNNEAGAAYVYFGGPGTLFDPTPDIALHGNAAGDRLGSSVGGAGDLNSDGFADLVIGAPHVGGELGAVYVYLGKRDGALATRTLAAQSRSLYFGLEVAAAGDIDGDGFTDLAVGMNPSAGGSGSVFFGDATGALTVSSPLRALSVGPIAGGSDVNGDGFADLLVSGGGSSGATLHFGGPDRMAFGTLAAPYGEPDPGFGSSVALPGDVDGDGFDDVLIGASERYQGGVGGAYFYAGGPKSSFGTIAYSKIVGPMAPGERSEWLVASPGDVNGDGFADLVTGSIAAGPSASGSVSIYTGGSRLVLHAPAYGTLRSR
jgi:hypothetical protein